MTYILIKNMIEIAKHFRSFIVIWELDLQIYSHSR